MARKNIDRDQAIYREHALGASIAELSAKYGLVESRVYQIVALQRALVPKRTSDELRQDIAAQLHELRREAHNIALSDPLPVHAPKSVVEDPEPGLTPVIGCDYSGQLSAMRTVVQLAHRLSKMYGLDTDVIETSGTVRYELVGVDVDDV